MKNKTGIVETVCTLRADKAVLQENRSGLSKME